MVVHGTHPARVAVTLLLGWLSRELLQPPASPLYEAGHALEFEPEEEEEPIEECKSVVCPEVVDCVCAACEVCAAWTAVEVVVEKSAWWSFIFGVAAALGSVGSLLLCLSCCSEPAPRRRRAKLLVR